MVEISHHLPLEYLFQGDNTIYPVPGILVRLVEEVRLWRLPLPLFTELARRVILGNWASGIEASQKHGGSD